MALHLTPPNPPQLPLRALKYAPSITLSFVLLNEDAAAGSYVRSWDIAGAIRGMLSLT
jgi:phosphatidylinositol glycan class S